MNIREIMFAVALAMFGVVAVQSDDRRGVGKDSPLLGGKNAKIVHAAVQGPRVETKSERDTGSRGDKGSRDRADKVTPTVAVRDFQGAANRYAALYAKIVKRHGWYEGVGRPLTPREASHLTCYYRLSRKQSSGPWTHIQALDGYGRLTTDHSIRNYLVNPYDSYDSELNPDVKDDLKSICQWECVAEGGIVVQECAYDSDGKLVLSYFPTPLSSNVILGRYVDKMGAPAHLRKFKTTSGEEAEGAEFVRITLDKRGYEVMFEFLDKDGRFRRNGDGAFMTVREYDAKGNLLKSLSCDALGRPVIDAWGNCGWVSKFDADNRDTLYTIVNASEKPMRMPLKRTSDDYIVAKRHYDSWGRKDWEAYYDGKGAPDTLKGGLHRRVYTYDDHGKETSMRREGLDGQLVDDRYGMARWVARYDDRGNQTYYAEFAADGKLAAWRKAVILAHAEYDAQGKQLYKNRYYSTDGTDSVLLERYVNDRDTTFYYEEGYYHVNMYDSLGNYIYAFYNLDGTPRIGEDGDDSYHKFTSVVERRGKTSIKVGTYYDVDGRPMRLGTKGFHLDFNVKRTVTDSVARYKVIEEFDGDRLLDKYGHDLDANCETTTSIVSYDGVGQRARSHLRDAYYYKVKVGRTASGAITYIAGENEFGEPAYVLNGDANSNYIYTLDIRGDGYYYKEDGDSITDLSDLKNSLCKAYCVEVVDTAAWKLGLRSGDLIVKYGNWNYFTSLSSGVPENRLCMETVETARQIKELVLMRHDPETKTSRMLTYLLPSGTPWELGFIYHKLYMTKREEQRYDSICKAFAAERKLDIQGEYKFGLDKFDGLNTMLCTFKPYTANASGQDVASKGYLQQGIIVGMKRHEQEFVDLYALGDTIDKLSNMLTTDRDSVMLYVTSDGESIDSIPHGNPGYDASFSLFSASEFTYGKVLALAQRLRRKKANDGVKKTFPKIAYKPSDAAARIYVDTESFSVTHAEGDFLDDENLPGMTVFELVKENDSKAAYYDRQYIRHVIDGMNVKGYKRHDVSPDNVLYYKQKKTDYVEFVAVVDNCQLAIVRGRMPVDDVELDDVFKRLRRLLRNTSTVNDDDDDDD